MLGLRCDLHAGGDVQEAAVLNEILAVLVAPCTAERERRCNGVRRAVLGGGYRGRPLVGAAAADDKRPEHDFFNPLQRQAVALSKLEDRVDGGVMLPAARV